MSDAHDELEVKARVDDPAAVERALAAARAEPVFRGEMIDRRFDRGGALEAKDEVLRLRIYRPADGGGGVPYGVLGWKGPVGQRGEYRHREEWETRVADPEAALGLLDRLGFAVVLRIDRTIAEYRLGAATVRLEWYPAMDVLVEVEGAPEAIERAARATGLPRAAFLPESLPHFVAAYERRTGRPARLAAEAR